MFSLILKGRNLRLIKTCVAEWKVVNPVKRERILMTDEKLNFEKFISSNKAEWDIEEHEGFRSAKDPQNFGKVVSLDLDDTQSAGQSNSKVNVKRKKKKKLENLQNRVETHNKETFEKFLDDIEKSGFKETKNDEQKSDVKKPGFEVTDASIHHLFRLVMLNLKSKKQRLKEGKIIIEGSRVIKDAISAGFQPLVIFYSRKSDIEQLNVSDRVKLYKVSYNVLQVWSDVTTSQGVVAVFKMPNLSATTKNSDCIPLTIICDNICEPSNMGSILRVAAAVGCKKLILTKGCVDIWNSKVLRAAAGAHFHIPVLVNLTWTEIENEVVDITKVILAEMGSNLPNEPKTAKEGEEVSNGSLKKESSLCDELPQLCYDSVNYKNENLVIVIGGEVHGVSDSAHDFAKEREGVRVFIPMCYNIECLNSAVALGILIYEVRRQMVGASISKYQQDSASKESSDKSELVTYDHGQILPVSFF